MNDAGEFLKTLILEGLRIIPKDELVDKYYELSMENEKLKIEIEKYGVNNER